jgi:hypothetical protein
MLVNNRVSMYWNYNCQVGCAAHDSAGNVLAKANRNGKEATLYYDLRSP